MHACRSTLEDPTPIREFAGRRATLGLDGWATRTLGVSAFVPQGRKPVFRLRTRMGLEIRATANHPFRQFAGWTALEDLRPGDRIAAARHVPVFGTTPLPDWEASLMGLMVSEGQCVTPGSSPVFTNEDPVLVDLLKDCARGLGVEVGFNGHLGYRLVNHLGRGGIPEKNRATLWLERHGMVTKSAGKSVPQAVFAAPQEAVRTFLQALFAGDGSVYQAQAGEAVFLEYASMSRRLVEEVRHLLLRFGIVSLLRDKTMPYGTTAHRLQVTDRSMILRFAELVGFVPGSEKQIRLETQILPLLRARGRRKSNFDTLPGDAWPVVIRAATSAGRALSSLGPPRPSTKQSVPLAVAGRAAAIADDPDLALLASEGPIWDVVESIEADGEEEVFDLTVPGAENFLANDLVVHNSTYARCGIIVNVTPLEPEWEGIITIEISNTTPLPAKIYANEGIAQILFFRAAADGVCETSYADRKGKYQSQAGLTLPKVL